MAYPPDMTTKCLMHMVMHLLKFPHGSRYCIDKADFGLERSEDLDVKLPRKGTKLKCFHWFADAAPEAEGYKGITGGVGMLARGPILTISQRQTLASPCTHSLEVVGAGTNINYLIPVSGLLQEVRIRLGRPVPFYLDSLSTVYAATSDASAKKSAWVLRR